MDKKLAIKSKNEIQTPERQVRARFTETIIRVYQAYPVSIADPALEYQRFVAPFKLERMTWIKPSFFWMMYRSGWASKEGQERILAIDISRAGFEWALRNACLSHFDPKLHASRESWSEAKQVSPVRIQWDPERDVELERLDYRSIQIGLGGNAAERYANEWVQSIRDITDSVFELRELKPQARHMASRNIIENELPYPVDISMGTKIGIQV